MNYCLCISDCYVALYVERSMNSEEAVFKAQSQHG